MELVTKKSDCKRLSRELLVKSPKEVIRRSLKQYVVKDNNFIVKTFYHSYNSN